MSASPVMPLISGAERNAAVGAAGNGLSGRRAAMVTFSGYPGDPRPRRAAEALLAEGMTVDLVCLADGSARLRESAGGLTVYRIPLTHTRGGKLRYAFNYSSFLALASLLLIGRLRRGRYHLVHVHNMPDVLVFSALVPKLLGAKVILDQHDPMPELMQTIFGVPEGSRSVRFLKFLEKVSLSFADAVVTVNEACRKIFSARSCPAEKITVVMNSPDEQIFPFVGAQERTPAGRAAGRFVLMYHGSLVARNGLDLAVSALARVRESVPGIELRVFGRKTPYLERVLVEAEEQGVAGHIRYLGPRRLEELPGEIGQCDIGVIPNHRNSFTDINTPTRLFEYLAVGKPVIAPRTAGIEDYFGADALVFFEPGNAEDLAVQILRAARHPDRTAATAERGQEVYRKHRWSQERARYVNLVQTLIDRKGTEPLV